MFKREERSKKDKSQSPKLKCQFQRSKYTPSPHVNKKKDKEKKDVAQSKGVDVDLLSDDVNDANDTDDVNACDEKLKNQSKMVDMIEDLVWTSCSRITTSCSRITTSCSRITDVITSLSLSDKKTTQVVEFDEIDPFTHGISYLSKDIIDDYKVVNTFFDERRFLGYMNKHYVDEYTHLLRVRNLDVNVIRFLRT